MLKTNLVKIAGLGCYLPKQVITNKTIEELCNLPAGWIKKKNGVESRRWVSEESHSFIAAQAAKEAVAQANIRLDEIDLLINASASVEQMLPDGGPLIQRELGLGKSGIPAFSVHATCLSFLIALNVASGLIATQQYRRILIISAETPSCVLNFKEPESASLLGDAAAAAVIVPTPANQTANIQAVHFETYGQGADLTVVKGGGSRKHPNNPQTTPEDNLFHMQGPQTLKMVHRHSANFLERLRPGLSSGLGNIKMVIPHQASMVGLRLLRTFGWPTEQVMVTLNSLGNCVAASIPVALYQAIQENRVKRGDELLLVGTAAGLSLGGIILTY